MNDIKRVLVVDDEDDILMLLKMTLKRMGLEVDTAENVQTALYYLTQNKYDLCLTDMRMPDGDGLEIVAYIQQQNLDIPIAVITAHGNAENAVSALKAGAFDYLSKPVSLDQLRTLVKSAIKVPKLTPALSGARELLGHAPAMVKARELITRVARSQAAVHITGESGSGKELAARLIVENSPRAQAPFVAVNCGAIPENLMESEFFGHKKGAFTGADRDKEGFFQAAHGGTLFLDEVADLPLIMQVKLLRVIQEKKVRKVGETSEQEIDVRIISATHNDLALRVQEGKFRQDLYYRLNVIQIQMPSLRDLREDILDIAQRTLDKLRGGSPIKFSKEALAALQNYNFPGNVRELENIVERALALCLDNEIGVDDLQLMPAETQSGEAHFAMGGGRSLPEYLDLIERQALLEALNQTRFNRTAAAKLLGITFRAIRYRMERLAITPPEGAQDD